ncbi:MAG: putative toxin-antitoxin system toxin component, PIN family [Sediminibacterium sp.]
MPKSKHRVIIDTNLWISSLLTKDFLILDKAFSEEKIILLFSEQLLKELIAVARRPKFRKYFSNDDLANLLTIIHERAEFISITSAIQICRDPKDDFLLSLSIDGNANILITGDKDLLEIGKFGKTRIITISTFLATIF